MTLEDSSPRVQPVSGKRDWAIAIVVFLLVVYPLAHAARLNLAARPAPAPPLTPKESALLQSSFQLYRQGSYREAIADSRTLLQERPDAAGAFNNMAVSYAALRMWDDAMRSAVSAMRLQPDFELAKNNLAWILSARQESGKTPQYFVDLSAREYQAGQFRDCIDSAQQALKLAPGLADAYNNAGSCYGALGLLDEAIRNDVEAIRIDPDHGLAKNNLAWALGQKQLQAAHARK